MKNIVFWYAILAVILFVLTVSAAAYFMEDYDQASQYISESFAKETVHGATLRYMGFIPCGILMTLFAFSAPGVLPKSGWVKVGFWIFGLSYGLGTIVTSIFPCDAGCNPEMINPSISQILHNLSAALMYLTLPLGLVLIGMGAKNWKPNRQFALASLLAGVFTALFVLMLFSDLQGPNKGLYQRIIEGGILVWIVYTAFQIRSGKYEVAD